ncbi:MAG: methyltransferase domain-containing protein [bacterium]|nr:methyltransferase domain-containing protein [bacterium]
MKFYDQLAFSYDAFIDWDARIKREDPFYQHIFRERLATSILDAGCGSGGHALHWAGMGYNVVGVDSSPEMIRKAREGAEREELDAEFDCLQLTDFASRLQTRFDAVVCVGNTLSHILNEENMLRFFRESAASLKDTGAAIFHCHNFQRILDVKKRDFPVRTRQLDGKEYVFCRFYDFGPRYLEFNMVVAARDLESGEWASRSMQMLHYPWVKDELLALLKQAGFTQVMCYGGFDFSEFELDKSNDLIMVCEFGETDE